MKTIKKSTETVNVSKDSLLSLVAAKLKDRVLFPKKFEDAKEYASRLTNVKFG